MKEEQIEKMQRGRKYREEDLFDMEKELEGFGGFRSMRPSLFGGRDPFDDPFFSRPFGSIFGSTASNGAPQMNRDKGVKIQELDSDEEEELKQAGGVHHGYTKEPSVEHPDDGHANEWNLQDVNCRSDANKVEGTKSKSRTLSFQTSRVSYGGVDGAYYTSTRTRRTGSDRTTLEESKEADSTTGQAEHRISRGIHDKGHSVTRRLNTDGKVDTLQTLHNLDKDELARFNETFEGNVQGHGHDWIAGHGNKGTSNGERDRGWMLPSVERGGSFGGIADGSFRGSTNRAKKMVRINIE